MHLRLVAQTTSTHVLFHTVTISQHTFHIRITHAIPITLQQLHRRSNVPRVTTIHQLVRSTIVTTLQQVLAVHQPLLFINTTTHTIPPIHPRHTPPIDSTYTNQQQHSTCNHHVPRFQDYLQNHPRNSDNYNSTNTLNITSTNTHPLHPTTRRDSNSTNDTSTTHSNNCDNRSLYHSL